jgi:hypothetical protein
MAKTFTRFPVTLAVMVPQEATVKIASKASLTALISKMDKTWTLRTAELVDGILLKRGAKLLMKGLLDGVSEDAAKEKLEGVSDFPAAFMFQLPEAEAAEEEKKAEGVVKLSDLPAVDGFASHGMFARVGRIAEVSDFACATCKKQPPRPSARVPGIWSEVSQLVETLSKNLDELTGQLVPVEQASTILVPMARRRYLRECCHSISKAIRTVRVTSMLTPHWTDGRTT